MSQFRILVTTFGIQHTDIQKHKILVMLVFLVNKMRIILNRKKDNFTFSDRMYPTQLQDIFCGYNSGSVREWQLEIIKESNYKIIENNRTVETKLRELLKLSKFVIFYSNYYYAYTRSPLYFYLNGQERG